jgi:hypothetical protein
MVEDFRAWVQGIGDGVSRAMQEDDIKQKVIDALKKLFENIGELTVEIAKLIIEFDKIVPQLSESLLESEVGKAMPRDIQATLSLPVHISAFAASFSSGDVGGMIESGLQALASLFGGTTPHAEGGIFTKPTMIGSHIFGERGPEALIPLDRLGDYTGHIGGNTGGDTVTVENVNISMPVSQKLTRHEIDNMANYLEQRILQLGKRRKGIWFGG